ncbi:30S ribosomal protein S2 [Egibacter rhizosphaerae]|uniref:Small ribosomal subunit protein uS2 n=1 Tax=Egibacter rhizosphaerae TaxID=1670831 RepID=A0A411YCP0_9ACTN|nr:30S ribosomal protein S2 [Egibacter rhizosphaerae]QBI18958.1 30S ribosomal protein S2 [Egibacter rhizosphaerae]
MSVVSMRELLEAGVHFGHQTRRWNPKMERYILGERNGIYIIDIQQTIAMLERSYGFVRDQVAKGGNVLFVGTKKQAQEPIETQAQRVSMPYVNYRWLGGMLTNFETIKTRLARLRELEELIGSETMERLPKKEGLQLQREYDKLLANLGGIRNMSRLPSALWVVDTVKEHIAVKEANRLGIPVVGILDSNCDPDEVQYPIPGNDDAIRSGSLLTKLIADACAEGHQQRAARSPDDVVAEQAAVAATGAPEAASEAEPLAEWEIALQREEAAAAAAQAGADSTQDEAEAVHTSGEPESEDEAVPAAEDERAQ